MRPRVQRAPGLPCALFVLRERTKWQTSDAVCRENEDSCLSSPRTRGPITPGASCEGRQLPHCSIEDARRMGPRVRGDDDEWPFEIRIGSMRETKHTYFPSPLVGERGAERSSATGEGYAASRLVATPHPARKDASHL